jgi:hypothetical protein
MGQYASDIEATGLLDMLYKQEKPVMHNMGFKCMKTGVEMCFSNHFHALKEKICDDMRPLSQLQDFLSQGHTLIMHNGITYDGEALQFFGYDISACKILDTLPVSWYLYPKQKVHGLEWWGNKFGVPKPPVTDWINGEQEIYNNRVMMDCRIQYNLWKKFYPELQAIYKGQPAKLKEFIQYLMFKMEQQRVQQLHRWKLNVPECTKLQEMFAGQQTERLEALSKVMPQVPVRVVKNMPKKCYKKDRSFSKSGLGWIALCKAAKKEPLIDGVLQNYNITVIKERLAGNPNSHIQLKKWLFDLGWVPETFEFKRNKETNETRLIPQVNIKNSGGKVCQSIINLIRDNPSKGLENLKGLGIINHRLGITNGFLKAVDEDGFIQARCQGLTNTLRLKHAGLVNLPSTRVPWGKELRGLLYFDGQYENLGSDLSSLEDRVKHHFQWDYDPEYVKKQMAPDYDPHLEICTTGNMLTELQVKGFKLKTLAQDVMDHISNVVRPQGKATNYSCQYGAGGASVARSAGVELSMGNFLKDTYWRLNWSINAIAEACVVKKVGKEKYLQNPINGFWYWLKADKDRFSTLCQGSGAYVCDMWIQAIFNIFKERYNTVPPLVAQFHDEIIMRTKKTEKAREVWRGIIQEAIQIVNTDLSLNRDMGCDCQFGDNYSEIH